ncbi:hypothetical protein HPB50_028126 [Hyalomma asiaticum]|nr:hypothetical protein HPB50_028126 [Hyalomma asiaticum]
MKADIAFQLFGDQVIKGLFVYKEHIQSSHQTVQPTVDFVKRMNRLIRVMTSRTSEKALKPDTPNMHFLTGCLEYLKEWEQHAKPAGGGFLTESTASGLRVTIKSTLDLLSYLTSTLGFKYLLTSRLSQDKLENLCGIIRQSSGCNDHPTVSQFLVTVNLLAFYNLAKPPRGGNCPPDVIKALLSPNELSTTTNLVDRIDGLLDRGSINDAEDVIQSLLSSDHQSYTEKKSNSALIYYVAGYVARKIISKNSCPQCAGCLCTCKYS